MARHESNRRPFKIILWVVGLALAATIGVLFWPYIGLIAAVLVPLLIIGSVVRSLIRELRGQRETYTVTHGTFGLSDVASKPETIRHFTTKNEGASDPE